MQDNTLPLLPLEPDKPVRFHPPTEQDCLDRAELTGLPENEARKFFAYYESNGWKVGKQRMVSWHMAMAGWKLRWSERQVTITEQGIRPVEIILRTKELDRIEVEIKRIRGDHEYTAWDDEDRARMKELKQRRAQLLKLLGMKV